MKRILFVRHAKTEPWDFGVDDFNRKLTNRGHKDSLLIAESLKSKELIPDFIYTSAAKRAVETTNLFAAHLDVPSSQIEKHDDLYEYVSTQDIQDLISRSSEDYQTIMIVGHNPWISNVAAMLSKDFQSIMPTTGTVCLEYKVKKWKEVNPATGKNIYYKTPKSFK